MKPRGRIELLWSPEDRRPHNAKELAALVEDAIPSAYGNVRLSWTSDGWRVDEAWLSTPQVYSGASMLTATQNMRQPVHETLAKAGLLMAPWPY